jgi:putative membrane protein
MHDRAATGIFDNRWDLRRLVLLGAAAVLLFASWLYPATRVVWDAVDLAFFRLMNATVALDDSVALFWALTGDRRFDYFSAMIVLIVYLAIISRGDMERLRQGLAFGISVSIILLVVIALQRELIEYPRLSPTLMLDAAHSIQSWIPWSRAKEASPHSFPGDHATVMMLLTLCWWAAFGRRIGLLALGLTIAFSLPRMAAGAHWLTDALVGGGFVTLLTAALIFGTPLLHHLNRAARFAADRAVDLWLAAIEKIGSAGEGGPNPVAPFLRGTLLGIAQLMPGVSGGSFALILGLYRRLIRAIASFDAQLLRLLRAGRLFDAMRHVDLVFLVTLTAGAAAGISFFSRVVPLELMTQELPEIMFGLFFGVIAAATVTMLRRHGLPHGFEWLWLTLGVAAGISMALLTPVDTPDEIWFLFLCGLAAAVAAMMPGLSAALMLLVLGKYAATIEAVARIDFAYLAPLIAGAVLGAVALSRLLSVLLARHAPPLMLAATGIMGGSLLAVWPFQHREFVEIGGTRHLVATHAYLPETFDTGVIMGLCAMLAGAAAYRLLQCLAAPGDGATTRHSPTI